MHPNPAFRQTPEAEARSIAQARGFGVLTVHGAQGPLTAHVPFELREDEAVLHLARSNAIARSTLPCPAVLIVSGPDAYVSPDWYGVADQVRTRNDVAVHLRGMLEPLGPEALRGHLDRVSATFEARLAPKAPWVTAKMTADAMERMMRAVLPVRVVLARVESTVKLNQNKTVDARAGAAAGIAAAPLGLGAEGIARAMREG